MAAAFLFRRIVLVCCLALTACPSVEAADDTLLFSHFANTGPLNPHQYTPNQMFAQEMVYEPLVALGDDGRIVPCLAESWTLSPDGTTYTFRLRQGVRFTDGQPFDATAVVRNFDAILDNRQRHAWLEITNKIAGYRAVDPDTFELVLHEPYHPALHDLATARPYRFLSPAAIPASGTTRQGILAPVGTGPWKRTESSLGVRDVFERNEEYWGGPPPLKRIVVLVIPDPMSRAMALETGEIELVYGHGQISPDVFQMLRNRPDFTTAVSRPMGCVAVAVNSSLAPTDDLRVRLALQHILDRSAIVRGVMLDTQPAANFLFPPDLPYCDAGLEPYRHDPQRAAALLDEADWERKAGSRFRMRDGRELTVDFCYIGNDPAHKAIAEVLQAQAAQAGIRLRLLGEEEDLFLRRQREGSFGMIISPTWGPPFEPHAMLGSMRQPSHADYQAQLGLPNKREIDRLITLVLETTDEAERAAGYRSVLTALHEGAVYLPLYYSCLFAAYRNGVVGNFHFGPSKTRYPFEILTKGE